MIPAELEPSVQHTEMTVPRKYTLPESFLARMIAMEARCGVPDVGPGEERMMSWLEDLSAAWKNEYADLDTTVLAPMTRLARLSVLIDTFQQEIVAPFGVSTGEYAVLAALRRAGTPYQLSPSKLYSGLQRSSGGMTKSLKNLELRGLVERTKDPHDGRGSLASLTPAGLDVQDQIFKAYLVATQELFSPLSSKALGEADIILTQLLDAFETGSTP